MGTQVEIAPTIIFENPRATAPIEATKPKPVQTASPHDHTVLVVDDENGPRQALRILLNEQYNVLLATDVDSALAVLDEEKIDIVITDIRMPKKTGVDLLREVKEKNTDIQVIIITGFGQLETAMQAVEHDAFAYLEKPFDNDEMLALVRSAVSKRSQEMDRRVLEQLALEANRFETFGRVVSGMVHDLGTPLSVIGSHIELMQATTSEPRVVDRLDTMNAQIRHCNDMVRTAMGFLRQEHRDISVFDFNNVIASCLDVAKPYLRQNDVEVTVDADPSLPNYEGNLVLMRQAVINLITNSCNAMEKNTNKKRIRISTSGEGTYLAISIEDNGPGIPEGLRKRVFDPFYTTRKKKGTGIGLTVVSHVMRSHQGKIDVGESVNGGAKFTLRFPLNST